MEQQHSKGKIEGFMTELGKKLDQFMDRARQGAEEARLAEKMEELKQAKEKLEQELHEFVQDDEKWREVQTHLQEAMLGLKKAFETTFRSKNTQATDAAQQNQEDSKGPETANHSSNT